ncbi:MAG: entry exclusion 1 domain-containing protein [Pseudomonadota bacterium]
MAKVGAQRASEITGRSKSTIQRAMNARKLSYEVDENGRRLIDVSELDRVFGLTSSGSIPAAAKGKDAKTAPADIVKAEIERAQAMLEMERLRMRVRMLEDQVFVNNQSIEDMKSQRDEWQKQAQQVLLTSQYSQKQAEDLKTQLAERDRRDEAIRQKRLQDRMRQMQGSGTNQNGGQAPNFANLKGPSKRSFIEKLFGTK